MLRAPAGEAWGRGLGTKKGLLNVATGKYSRKPFHQNGEGRSQSAGG